VNPFVDIRGYPHEEIFGNGRIGQARMLGILTCVCEMNVNAAWALEERKTVLQFDIRPGRGWTHLA